MGTIFYCPSRNCRKTEWFVFIEVVESFTTLKCGKEFAIFLLSVITSSKQFFKERILVPVLDLFLTSLIRFHCSLELLADSINCVWKRSKPFRYSLLVRSFSFRKLSKLSDSTNSYLFLLRLFVVFETNLSSSEKLVLWFRMKIFLMGACNLITFAIRHSKRERISSISLDS